MTIVGAHLKEDRKHNEGILRGIWNRITKEILIWNIIPLRLTY